MENINLVATFLILVIFLTYVIFLVVQTDFGEINVIITDYQFNMENATAEPEAEPEVNISELYFDTKMAKPPKEKL